jgi:hypothetical protein
MEEGGIQIHFDSSYIKTNINTTFLRISFVKVKCSFLMNLCDFTREERILLERQLRAWLRYVVAGGPSCLLLATTVVTV